MEGRVLANSGWHPGGRRFYKKIGGGCQAKGGAAIQFHEIETAGGERRGEEAVEKEKENEKISLSAGVSRAGMESTEERAEEQKWRREEQLRRVAAAAAEGEEWKRKGGGWPLERIILTDEEEDGVNGGRMKPLASFDVNRGMPPAQNRKLRIKLSPPDNIQPPIMDGAAPKTIRRAQEKENGGLVPLCPGTTQIRGFKRKTTSPTDLKPQGGKRNRPPFGPGKENDQSRKEPTESSPSPPAEIESEESHGMDMLLMALKAADPNSERAISPSLPLAKPRVIQAVSGEKAGKNSKPTTKVVGAIMPAQLYRPPQGKIKENVDARKEDDVEGSCIRNDDVGEDSEGFQPCPRTKTCNKASPPPEFFESFFAKYKARWMALTESDNLEDKLEASKEEDGSDDTEDDDRVTSKTASKTTTSPSDTSRDGEEMPVVRDDELHEYAAATVHLFRPHPPVKPLGKGTNLLDGRRKENRGEKSPRCSDKIKEARIKPHLPKLHPSQSRVLLSQQQNFNQRVPKECRISGASCSTVLDSHQQLQQRKVIEREPTAQNSGASSISLRGEGPEIAEKSQDRIREVLARDIPFFRKDASWTKFQLGPRQQSTKESSAAGRNASNERPWEYVKKRKGSDHVSSCCIVPKQVKLARASSLIETGEPSHPSVGSVVVECLPPSTEQRKDDTNNRAPFCELQNRDALWSQNSLQLPHLKSATDAGPVRDTSKENRSWNVSSTSASDHCPSTSGFKAPCKQVYDGAAEAPRVPRVAGSITLAGTLSANGNSLLSLQNSKTHLGSSSHSAHGTHPQQQQQQQRSGATLAAGSITRTRDDNEDSETHHEIAGITMQRRSWEALKAAEYFAKRRFHPDAPEAPFDQQQQQHHRPNNVPSIPSRFQGGVQCHHHHGQGVVSTLKTKFGATLVFDPSATTDAFSAYVDGKKVASRRAPYKVGNKPEKLSMKVLNRNLENYALKDGAPNFQNGAQGFPGNGCHNSTHLPRSGLPKAPTLKTRQRRGQKKLEKEKFKAINVKPSSGVCNFKPLSEPSGLLGDCNPGIIQRVRNSVQIHAILGAFIGAASYNNSRVPKVPLDAPSVQLVITEGKGELTEISADVQETLRTEKCSPHAAVQETVLTLEYSTQAETLGEIERTSRAQENSAKIIEIEKLPHAETTTAVEVKETVLRFEYSTQAETLGEIEIERTFRAQKNSAKIIEIEKLAHAETTTAVEVKETVLRLEYSTQGETLGEIERTSRAQENSAKIIEIEKLRLPQDRNTSEDTLDPEEVAVSTSERREAHAVLPGDLRQGLPETTAVLVSLTDTAVDADCLHEQSESVKQGPSSVCSEDPAFAEEANDNDEEPHPMSGTDSSPSVAGLTGRWLELLTLEIKDRLSVVKRSRSRLQSTLQSEELNPSESGGAARVRAFDPLSKTRSSIDIMDVPGSQQSVSSDAMPTTAEARQDESSSQQLDTWRAIFTSMDDVLVTEATKLEGILLRTEQMQAFWPSSNQQQPSVAEEKYNVAAAAFQGGLASKHQEVDKQQSPQRLPFTIEAIQKQLGFFATTVSMMSAASDFATKPQASR